VGAVALKENPMTIIAVVPFLVAIVGAIVFCLASNGNAKELGRGAYWMGVLVVLWSLMGHVIRIG